ncbi:right-handed parallel beta-helix repeat-containing protein [Treponema sp. OttesenSCG-928-L16]|nr:right-handed parallel beta-helix repeat-containing protein [Treponema sp. OttesenSCG-928-L16]
MKQKRILKPLFFLSMVVLIILGCKQPTDSIKEEDVKFYVVEGGGGTCDGSSWANAFGDVQEAIKVASLAAKNLKKPTYVLIKAGTYIPLSAPNIIDGTDLYNHFSLQNNVCVIGGFAGTESGLEPDTASGGITILSGDLNGDDSEATESDKKKSDNTYHVFYHPEEAKLNNSAVLKNVTISGGYARSSMPHTYGGGMYNQGCSPTIVSCTFSGNATDYHGGGIFNTNSSNPIIDSCIFFRNTAVYNGGGIHNGRSNPRIYSCAFIENKATGTSGNGGGIVNGYSSPIIDSCTFSGNTAYLNGGGIYNINGSSPIITSCTLSGNTAASGGGIFNYYESSDRPVVCGSILFGNIAASNAEYYGDFSEDSCDNQIGGEDSTAQGKMEAIFETVQEKTSGVYVAVLTENTSYPPCLMVKEDAADLMFDLSPVSWTVPATDQRGFLRKDTGSKGYKGSIDPRATK